MPSRIAYLVTEDWAFLRHRLPMARAARDAGFEVHVLTRVGAERAAIEHEGFHVHALQWQRRSLSPCETMVVVLAVRRALMRIRPHVLHNVAVKPVLVGSLAATGIANMATVNSIVGLGSALISSSWKHQLLGQAIKTTFSSVLNRRRVVTIVQNPDDREFLKGIGVASDRVWLIPGSGVDTDVFEPTPEPLNPPLRLVFVGRMLEDKGVRTLVKAFRDLRTTRPNIELYLAGEPDPENPTSISRGELEGWNAEEGIVWLGHVDDINALWSSAHIAVLPSRREGFPKSLLEAAACGRPLVASDVPGCREIVEHGVTGFLARVDDPVDFADKLALLIDHPHHRQEFGRAARDAVVQKFSARLISQQTAELYARCLANVPSHE